MSRRGGAGGAKSARLAARGLAEGGAREEGEASPARSLVKAKPTERGR